MIGRPLFTLVLMLTLGACGGETTSSSVADSPWVGLHVSTPQEFDRLSSEREIERRIKDDGITRKEATALVLGRPRRAGPWILLHLRADGSYFMSRTSHVPPETFPQSVDAYEGSWRVEAEQIQLRVGDGSEVAIPIRDGGLEFQNSGLPLILRRAGIGSGSPWPDGTPPEFERFQAEKARHTATREGSSAFLATQKDVQRDLRNLLGWLTSLKRDGVDVQGISADASGYWRFECELPQKHDTEDELLREWRSRLNGTHVQLLWARIRRNRSSAAPVTALFRLRPCAAIPDNQPPLVSAQLRNVVSIAAMKSAVQLAPESPAPASDAPFKASVIGTGTADSGFKLLYNVAARTLWVHGRYERFDWVRGTGGTEPADGTCVLLGGAPPR